MRKKTSSEDKGRGRWYDPILLKEEERRGKEGGSHAITTFSTMMFTATQITDLFTETNQMGISARTRQALEDEGITIVADIHEWGDDEW